MSTSVIKKEIIKYLYMSIFCGIFGLIYEHFSHNVYSGFMLFSFLIPLISTILCFIMYKSKGRIHNRVNNNLLFASTITLTLGSLVKGVLDIYGTTNKLVIIYLYLGIGLLIINLILYVINLYKLKKTF